MTKITYPDNTWSMGHTGSITDTLGGYVLDNLMHHRFQPSEEDYRDGLIDSFNWLLDLLYSKGIVSLEEVLSTGKVQVDEVTIQEGK